MGYLTYGNLEDMQDRTVAINKANGWYDKEVSIPEMIALLHSECSEALEAWRNNIPITTTIEGKPEGLASEFADIAIRLFDYSARLNINLIAEINRKLDYNATRSYRHGGKKN